MKKINDIFVLCSWHLLMSTYKYPWRISSPADKPTEKQITKPEKPRGFLRNSTVVHNGKLLSDIEKIKKLLSTVPSNLFTVKSGPKNLPGRLLFVVLHYINPFSIITWWGF